MKIVYMGTPQFAVPPLEALVEHGIDVVAVITMEDKLRGRGHKLKPTPVKEAANRLGIKTYEPHSLKSEATIDLLKSFDADMFVVAAYGKILTKEILSIPPQGCINIHASLLPAYRGAAPIQHAIMDGCKKTGITTMMMDTGLDTGDMLRQYPIDISDDDTGDILVLKLADIGAHAIVDTIDAISNDEIKPIKQSDATTEYASMITKDMAKIDWNKPAISIERLVRAMNSQPGAFTRYNNDIIKIWKTRIVDKHTDYLPGTIIDISDGITVQTQDICIIIEEMQSPGKNKTDSRSYLMGHRMPVGSKFEEE